MWMLLSENSFLGALVSGIAIIILVAIFKSILNKYKASRVFNALKSGLTEKNHAFLPTSYLAAKTNYTQAKVEQLCSSHRKIKRNEKELESWQVID